MIILKEEAFNTIEEVKKLKQYAAMKDVPIMVDETADFITNFIKEHRIRSVLELGTAIGYSAIMMALSDPNVKITSIERDSERYLEAVKNVKLFGLEDRITLIFKDALEAEIEGEFDLIFIDAAKGQNIKFFERYEKNLAPKGFIITDNMGFHGLVNKDENEIQSKNVRGLVRKIKEYISYLQTNLKYMTVIHEVGDGIAVTERR